jgi:hypothetical protein
MVSYVQSLINFNEVFNLSNVQILNSSLIRNQMIVSASTANVIENYLSIKTILLNNCSLDLTVAFALQKSLFSA